MRAYLALGANIGARRENLRLALRWLSPQCRVVAVSSLYASPAMVVEGAPAGPEFLNATCAVDTDLPPAALLAHAKRIEHAIGRRPAPRWSARPIDIDILLYGDLTLETEALTIPHPGIAERAFVLAPLAEIAAEALHPVLGRTIGEIAADFEFTALSYIDDPGWAQGDTATLDA